jgi:hypothetical protein
MLITQIQWNLNYGRNMLKEEQTLKKRTTHRQAYIRVWKAAIKWDPIRSKWPPFDRSGTPRQEGRRLAARQA